MCSPSATAKKSDRGCWRRSRNTLAFSPAICDEPAQSQNIFPQPLDGNNALTNSRGNNKMKTFIPLTNLVLREFPPLKRRGFSPPEHNDHEHRLSEAAVMLAFANYLFDQGATEVTINPDGMHGKQFKIRDWLLGNGYTHESSHGRTDYGGMYVNGSRRLRVWLRAGQGDVSGMVGNRNVVAECKGGVFNSSHNGVRSSLRSGLREAIGALMERPTSERNIAVVPDAEETRKFAERAVERTTKAGIEIALVTEHGEIKFVSPQ